MSFIHKQKWNYNWNTLKWSNQSNPTESNQEKSNGLKQSFCFFAFIFALQYCGYLYTNIQMDVYLHGVLSQLLIQH